MRTVAIAGLTAAGVAAVSGLLSAGPLSPAAGPVAPTYKTLGEIEPRVPIGPSTTPGDAESMYLISQPGSYYLTGPILGQAGKHGIRITASGPVTLDLGGFEMSGHSAEGATLDGVLATTSLTRLIITNGAIRSWGGAGLRAQGASASVRDVIAELNGDIGLQVGPRSVLTGCLAIGNGDGGLYAESGSVITNCTAQSNDTFGIRVGAGGVLDACAAFFNDGDGMLANSHAVITKCSSNNNTSDGFQISGNCRITDCVANVNFESGIRSTISGCDIQGNTVQGNNGAGIELVQFGNFVARNTARGNGTNYSWSGTQTMGPIVAATGTITNTNPWANFSF